MVSFGAAYLEQPDLFPARGAGEPWGPEEVSIDVAGGPYRFTGLSSAQSRAVLDRFENFCRQPRSAESAVTTRLFRASESGFRPVDTRGWEYALDIDYAPASVRMAGMDLMGRIDWAPGARGALWTSDSGGPAFDGVLENFFRILVAYRLAEAGGALLHSAGVVDGREARLFLGRSGAGKTTISRHALATGRRVLSDDINGLLPGSSRPVVRGLPFAGDLGHTTGGEHPLAGLHRIEQAQEHHLQTVASASAVAWLTTCAPYVNADPYRSDRLIANLEKAVRSVPLEVLSFARDCDFWDLLSGAGAVR